MSIARRHGERLTIGERCHVRAAAIVRGDDPDLATGGGFWPSEAAAAWSGAGDTLERAGLLALADADADRLRARLAGAVSAAADGWRMLADVARIAAENPAGREAAGEALAESAAMLAEAAKAAGEAAASVEAERDHCRRLTAVRYAGFRAWAAEAYGAEPLALLEAAGAAHVAARQAAGDRRDLPAPGAVAEQWREAAAHLAAIMREVDPDPAAVEAERDAFAASEANNRGAAA